MFASWSTSARSPSASSGWSTGLAAGHEGGLPPIGAGPACRLSCVLRPERPPASLSRWKRRGLDLGCGPTTGLATRHEARPPPDRRGSRLPPFASFAFASRSLCSLSCVSRSKALVALENVPRAARAPDGNARLIWAAAPQRGRGAPRGEASAR